MWLDWLLLVVGMLLLIKGADFFVDGASKIAKAMKIPALIIGLAAMVTSIGFYALDISSYISAG